MFDTPHCKHTGEPIFQVRRLLQQLLPSLGIVALSTTLGTSVAIAGQVDQNAYEHSNNQGTLTAVATQTAPATTVPVIYTQSASPLSSTSLQQGNLPPELQGEGKWEAFRALWRELDEIHPRAFGGTLPAEESQLVLQERIVLQAHVFSHLRPSTEFTDYPQRAYYQALSQLDAERLSTQLADIFGYEIEGPESPSGRLLYRLTQLRILELSQTERLNNDCELLSEQDPASRVAMTRAGPLVRCQTLEVSPTRYLINTIDRIQLRANALAELRASNTINGDTYAQALNALLADSKLALYLDMLTSTDTSVIPFEASDFTSFHNSSVNTNGADSTLDMHRIQTWENAANHAANKRRAEVTKPNAPNMLSSFNAQARYEAIKVMLQNLSVLREHLGLLDPLLADLEH